jgi:nitrogen fixation protein NifU and related proteins
MKPEANTNPVDSAAETAEEMIQYWVNLRNLGRVERPDGIGRVSRVCGDGLELTLRINHGTVTEAKFYTEGCGSMLAAGEVATDLARGKSIQDAFRIGEQAILEQLSGLPADEAEHCAVIASGALKEAIKDYLAYKRDPWKRVYQRD